MIDQFWDLKFIKEPSDIFKLNFKDIKNLEGWGELSISNLEKAISKSQSINLDKFIFSIGIRHIGQENAKILAGFFGTIKEFCKIFDIKFRQKILTNLLDLDGIGETQVSSIKSFFSNKANKKVVNELENVLLIKDAVQNSDDGLLNNKTFLVTGKLNGISRAEVKSLIEENSGKTISSVSKKLNFLIIGEKPTKKKVDYAKQLKIKVIDQAEFLKMLNKRS